jgi:parvulin-like peptidyl-prolyl isomerase
MVRPFHMLSILAAVAVIAGAVISRPTAAAGAPAAPPSAAQAPKLPTVNGRQALATVNGDPVTLDEFVEQLGMMHQNVQEPTVKVRHQEPYDLLDRLINIKLLLQEARNIGLDDDPGFKRAMATYRREAMVMILLRKRSAAVTSPDPAAVRTIYESRTREAKVTSYLVEKEEDAKEVAGKLKAGGNLDAVAKPLVDSGRARAGEQGSWLKMGEMLPQVRSAVEGVGKGSVSAPIPVSGGFAFIRLDDARVTEDPAARREAERQALEQQRANAVKDYVASLVKRDTKVDQKLLDRLDYETAKGFDPYLSDTRPVARIEGDAPVTVKDLSEAMVKKYYHGAEKAITQKKVNVRKPDVLNEILSKRVLYQEAKRQRIGQTQEFRRTVKEYEEGVLFGAFIERAIDPDIKVGDPELRAYLAAHISEYTSPEMMRLDGLAFGTRKNAEAALGKLRKGDDFGWVRGNAPGQIPPGSSETLLQFDPHPIVTSSFPPDLRKALAGAAKGDYRLSGSGDGPFYVILVREIVPARPQTLEEVRDTIAKKAFEEKREEGVRDWAKKLRSAYPVKTYVTRESLGEILRGSLEPKGV